MSFKTLSGDRTINAARAACHKSLFSVSPVRLAEAPASPAARRANPCGACPQRPPRLHGLRLGRASSFCAQGSRSCGLFRTGSWFLAPGQLGCGRSQRCARSVHSWGPPDGPE